MLCSELDVNICVVLTGFVLKLTGGIPLLSSSETPLRIQCGGCLLLFPLERSSATSILMKPPSVNANTSWLIVSRVRFPELPSQRVICSGFLPSIFARSDLLVLLAAKSSSRKLCNLFLFLAVANVKELASMRSPTLGLGRDSLLCDVFNDSTPC